MPPNDEIVLPCSIFTLVLLVNTNLGE